MGDTPFDIQVGFIDLRDIQSDTDAYRKAVEQMQRLKQQGLEVARYDINVKDRDVVWVA
ncbi:hypothetical protein skT53_30130 [Effusibacillus dendaii]|uniref:Uncharacterized protein n=1 Tax=Effusibacillus dendaii TaxID=2743772 RepID=A0A7I8DCW6_9BACL|nr:hypothetical protein skT53_30130 [Effusibacillus dendaii]